MCLTVLFLGLFTFSPVSFSQGGFGTIAGQVVESSGGGIASATLRVMNSETGANSVIKSDPVGFYQFLQLLPGLYDISVEAPGFKKLERKGIRLRVGDRIVLDLPLELGAISESVTVTGEVSALRTSDAQTGEVVTRSLIRDLPQLQRDPFRLLVLAGNVQGGGSRAEGGNDTRINGGRTGAVEYLIDGITAGTGLGHRVIQTIPTMETVGEFKVITNGISAEYGRLSGGAVELVTRGGTNEFHGEVFEYLQNPVLNANPWLQNALGGKKVQFTQNIYGGVIGGPVWVPKLYNGRNRTFFLFNYQGIKRRQGGALRTLSVPTAAERAGDFTGTFFGNVRPVIYDQDGPVVFDAATNTHRRTLLIGDGKHIPANRVDPVAAAILKLLPLPNQAPRAGSSSIENFVGPQTSKVDASLWAVRLDHQLAANHRVFGRFTTQNNDSASTRVGGVTQTAPESHIEGAFGVTLNYDWAKSPTFLVNLRAGGNFNPFSSGAFLPSDFSSASIPFDPITRGFIGNNLPIIGLSGMGAITVGQNINVTNTTTYDFGMTATKIAGRHTLKLGAQHRRYYDNQFASGSSVWNFIGDPVHETAGFNFGAESPVGNAYTIPSFMLGIANRVTTRGDRSRATNFNYYAAFIQDDFKVTSRLTLNLGLRWDMETPLTERYDRITFWDPDAPAPFKINPGYNFAAAVRAAGLDPATVRTPDWAKNNAFPRGALGVTNTPEYPSRLGSFYHPWQFAPRFGAAYQINSKTVARGFYGIIYNSTHGAQGGWQTGNETDVADAGWHASNDNLIHVISTFKNPYRPGDISKYQRTVQAANFQAAAPLLASSGFNRKTHMPHEHAISFGIQRELPSGFLVEATYNANLGRELLGPDVISVFPRDLLSGGPTGFNQRAYTTQVATPHAGQGPNNAINGPATNLGVLQYQYPYFSAMAVQNSNIGRSNYNAMNLRLEHRTGHGLFFLANYTFSKALDDVGGVEGSSIGGIGGNTVGMKQNQTVDPLTDNYGVSPLDETHVLRFSYNWEIPVGRGKKWLGSGNTLGRKVADYVVGGWQLAGLGSYRSGRPVMFDFASSGLNAGNLRIERTYGTFATSDPNVVNPLFTNKSQVFYSSRDPRPANLIRAFTNLVDTRPFVYGTVPPIFPNVRHPGRTQYDMSLMKSFPFTADGGKYLQFRVEGSNIFNIRGWGDYNATVGFADFGLITSVTPSRPAQGGAGGRTPSSASVPTEYGARTIQVSARIIF